MQEPTNEMTTTTPPITVKQKEPVVQDQGGDANKGNKILSKIKSIKFNQYWLYNPHASGYTKLTLLNPVPVFVFSFILSVYLLITGAIKNEDKSRFISTWWICVAIYMLIGILSGNNYPSVKKED